MRCFRSPFLLATLRNAPRHVRRVDSRRARLNAPVSIAKRTATLGLLAMDRTASVPFRFRFLPDHTVLSVPATRATTYTRDHAGLLPTRCLSGTVPATVTKRRFSRTSFLFRAPAEPPPNVFHARLAEYRRLRVDPTNVGLRIRMRHRSPNIRRLSGQRRSQAIPLRAYEVVMTSPCHSQTAEGPSRVLVRLDVVTLLAHDFASKAIVRRRRPDHTQRSQQIVTSAVCSMIVKWSLSWLLLTSSPPCARMLPARSPVHPPCHVGLLRRKNG